MIRITAALFIVVYVTVSLTAQGQVQKATEEDDHPFYSLSCVTTLDKPLIMYEAKKESVFTRTINPGRNLDFGAEQFIYIDGTQFMKGVLSNLSGRQIFRGPEYPKFENDKFYILSEQWDCALYRGFRRWPDESSSQCVRQKCK